MGATGTRRYVSPLREQRAEETRTEIVNAAAVLVGSGNPPELRIPAVADGAGVSVATVYRHFPSKDDLVDAIYEHWMKGARRLLESMPTDREARLEHLSELWREQSSDEGLERAMSIYSPSGRAARRRRLAHRRAQAAEFVADVRVPDERVRRHLESIVLLLTSTTAHRHLREYWDMTTEDAAAAVTWAVRGLVDTARKP
jgi:AcrR family transcriptional regulator